MLFNQKPIRELTTEILTHVDRSKADPILNTLTHHKEMYNKRRFNQKDFSKDLHDAIFKVSGLNVRVKIGKRTAIHTPVFTKVVIVDPHERAQHGLIDESVYDEVPQWLIVDNNLSVEDGIIYPEKLEVGGAFSKVITVLLWNPEMTFTTDMTVEEVVGVVLHEMGHVYTRLATLHWLYLSNAVLTTALNTKRFDPYTVTLGFKSLLASVEQKDLRSTKDRNKYIKLARIITLRNVKQLQRLNFSTGSTSEDLADMYAGHFGYVTYTTGLLRQERPRDPDIPLRVLANKVLARSYGTDTPYLVEYAFSNEIRNSKALTYRKLKERMKLNLNLMANRMRLMKGISSAEQKRLREAYDEYNTYIRRLPEPSPYVANIVPKLLGAYRSGMYLKEIDRETEDLLDNPLWISASHKI